MDAPERMQKAEEMLQVLAAYGVDEYDARCISKDMVYIMDHRKHLYKPFTGAAIVVPQNEDSRQRIFHEPKDG